MDGECLEWDLSTISPLSFNNVGGNPNFTADLRHLIYPLPRQLWHDADDVQCCEGTTLVQIELIMHALRTGQGDIQPEFALLILHAAKIFADDIALHGDDEAAQRMTAFCALRALEMVLRYQQPMKVKLMREICNKAALAVAAITPEDPLLRALLSWLRYCISDPTYGNTLFEVLDRMQLSRIEATCDFEHRLAEPLLNGSLIATPTGVLLLDNWNSLITQYTHGQIRYEYECDDQQPNAALHVVVFEAARRGNGEITVTSHPYRTQYTAESSRWFDQHLPDQVEAWVQQYQS